MTFETLLLEISEHVATITLNCADRMNAIDLHMKSDLASIFMSDLLSRQDVRAIVITGSGDRAFCAGADIKERSGQDLSASEFIESQMGTYATFNAIADSPLPTIAAINGVALGGGLELALCCDVRLAATTAKLGLTEVNLGVIPAGGGTQRLARLIGASRAKRMLFTGAVLTAAEAAAVGLVETPTAPADLTAQARALAVRIARQPQLAVRFAKKAIDHGLDGALPAGLEFELQSAAILFASEDRKEGMRAFVEKRAPKFQGR